MNAQSGTPHRRLRVQERFAAGKGWPEEMDVHPARTLRMWDSVVTLGAFDGIHRGHQALIQRTVFRAAQLGVPSVAYTFDPPPKAVFGDAAVITPRAEKVRRLEALGLDCAVVANFDAAFAARDAEDFIGELADLNPAEVWVGPDFRFGRGQAGDIGMLGRYFDVRVFEPVTCTQGQTISSSRVRALMVQGAAGDAQDLLGWSSGTDDPEEASVGPFAFLGWENDVPLLSPDGAPRPLEMQPRDYSYVW